MKFQRKILLYFSSLSIPLIALALLFIYTLFAEYREEEFQQQQKEKITTTIRFLTEIEQIEEELIQAMDRLTIHDFYDEKLLIFDANKELIYSSIDDTPIPYADILLDKISDIKTWYETKDELYDVVAVYVEIRGHQYYGISKAYDAFGYSKLAYLRYILLFTFFAISISIILLAFYMAGRISRSIEDVTKQIKNYNFQEKYIPILTKEVGGEVAELSAQFNNLLQRMYDAFAFQKHAIHHISHELKTPISILVSNFDNIEKENLPENLYNFIQEQKADTKSLGEIIQALLEISKAEAGHNLIQDNVRMDELIFDIANELKLLFPNFSFAVNYGNIGDDENQLIIHGNERLLRSAIMNLMLNSIHYSSKPKGAIDISVAGGFLQISFQNQGKVLSEKEQEFLFQHFFRGENSKGIRGFGLGLVFIHKIVMLHHGNIDYKAIEKNTNQFQLTLPLPLKPLKT